MTKLNRIAVGCALALAGSVAAADVVLVRHVVAKPTRTLSQDTVDGFLGRLARRLTQAGVAVETLADRDVTPTALSSCRVVLFPYNPSVPEPVVAAVAEFVRKGGRLGLFYSGQADLLRLVGVSGSRYLGGDELPKLTSVVFQPGRLREAPDQLRQRSWNVVVPSLVPGGGAVVAGTWIGSGEAATGLAALTLHRDGFAFGHVYLDEDPQAGKQWLLALLEHYAPGVWSEAVRGRLRAPLGYADCPDLAALERRARDGERPEAVAECLRAGELRVQGLSLVEAGQLTQAEALAERSVESAERAYLLTQRTRQGELRGAWIHSAYGIADWGWDRSIRVLAENGFNAVFPNMCWGAVADYPSTVLPVHPDVAEKGDQIALCLAACRKYGVELHVWRVNWNMGHRTPAVIRQQMIAAGRVQVTDKGEPSMFLAPHIEANFAQERDAMLEIVRKYPVDGIHFDYIRYPGEQCDFSESARQAFSQWHGSAPADWPRDGQPGGRLRAEYNRWRRANINRLVQSVSLEAHRLRPGIRVSAAVFGAWEGTPDSIAQDPVEWIANGWLDFVCPMNYTNSDAYLVSLLQMQSGLLGARVPLYCGIGSWEHSSAARTAGQIDLARRFGADGFVCFALTERFADAFLPALALGSTRGAAGRLLPHHPALRLRFAASEPDPDLERNYPLRRKLTIDARLPAKAYRFEPQVTVLRNGYPFIAGTALDVDQEADGVVCTLRPREPGTYQIEVGGTVQATRLAAPTAVLSRSFPVRVLSVAEAEEARVRTGPPVFRGDGGARVGVWSQNGYGAAPILEALRGAKGLDVAPLYNLKPESLKACHVVIMPQPRTQVRALKEPTAWDPLREYVRRGGGLLVTHALVGVRGFPAPLPEVATGGEVSEVSDWRVRTRQAATRAVSDGVQRSTFADCITLVPGSAGMVLLENGEGRPVAVQGRLGRGRYVACGLGLGIGSGDRDVPMGEAEACFLTGAVEWLAGRHSRR